MNLRPYQETMCSQLAKSLRDNKRIVGQLATGGGKTVIFSAVAERYTSNNDKAVLILVHRKELLLQTRKTLFNMYGIRAELIVAGTRYIPPAKVYIGMVESVNNRIARISNVGLVIIDESHIAVFNKMHSHYPNQFILGFTATPLSSNKRFPMKLYYKDIVCGVDIADLIKMGFLCRNVTWAPKEIVDRAHLAVKNGEFDESLMALEFRKPKFVDATVKAYEKRALGKKTAIYNVNVEHSKEVCAAFVAAGYPCKHLDGTMSDHERKAILKWLKETPNAIICSIGILTTGFDEPTIECIMVNKSTLSLTLWLQMCGRGGRIVDEAFIAKFQNEYPYLLNLKFHFDIIDMGGNALTHGDWCDVRDWKNLFHNPPKLKEDGIAPVKECPQCEGIVPASTRVCKLEFDGEVCGYEFPVKPLGVEELLNEFVVVTKNIDASAIVNANRERKEYFSFYRIGTILAHEAKNTITTDFTDEMFDFILAKYFDQCKLWAKTITKNRLNDWNELTDKPKRVIFDPWHQDKARQHLETKLKEYFPTWKSQ